MIALLIFSVLVGLIFAHKEVNNTRLKADFAIFLIGDSISMYLYAHIAARLNCKLMDPNKIIIVEQRHDQPYYCDETIYNATFRLGYIRHWGVSHTDRDFYSPWKGINFPATNSNSSILNIKNAVREFKQRSNSDHKVTYIFLSNLWDSHRYFEKYSTHDMKTWLLEYKTNYTKVVKEMIRILHAGKSRSHPAQLVLQTQYHVSQKNHFPIEKTVSPMNNITRFIAKIFNLSIFDTEVIMRDVSTNATKYLADYVHLDKNHFDLLAKLVLIENWT